MVEGRGFLASFFFFAGESAKKNPSLKLFLSLSLPQDPTVLAWELMNEPHTDDGFEATLKLSPGSILCAWVAEMTAFIKSLDSNHLIATGEEGYRADLTADSSSHSWLNNGLKGGDFVCNTCRTGITLATVHCYPDSWGFTSSNYGWLGENFLADRRRAALACGSGVGPFGSTGRPVPAILEEVRVLFLLVMVVAARCAVLHFLSMALFLHGIPECWLSWRRLMMPLVETG